MLCRLITKHEAILQPFILLKRLNNDAFCFQDRVCENKSYQLHFDCDSMSDSDGVPGEIEYSDDEDYIRNQSVLSARRTKIDSSIVDEHSHNHHQTHTHHHQRRSHQENQTTAQGGHTQAEHNQASQEEKEQPRHVEDSAREEETMGTERDRKVEGRQEGMVSVSISQLLTSNQPQSAILQEETSKIQSLHQQEEHPKELTNHQETGEKPLQSEDHELPVQIKIEQLNEQQKKIEEEVNENHLQHHLNKHQAELPSSQQQEEIEIRQVEPSPKIETAPQKKEHQNSEQISHKIQTAAIQQQQKTSKEHLEKQTQIQSATNQQKEQLPNQQVAVKQTLQSQLESHPQNVQAEHHNPAASVHGQSQSQRDLLAGIHIIPKSSESEFSEKVVQRKLFKTDLQKDEQDAHLSSHLNPSQEVEQLPLKQEKQMSSELESAGDVKRNSLNEGEVKSNSIHELMSIPQRKSRAEDLNEKRREDTLPMKSQACKCMIM